MIHTRVEFPSTDGRALVGRWLTPEDQSDALEEGPVTVIHPATAVPQTYYDQYAEHLVAWGHTVLTYDYRGIGLSRRGSLRAERITLDHWMLRDFRAACDLARRRAAGGPLFYVGHSLGGHSLLRTGALHEPWGNVTVGCGSGYVGLAPERLRPLRRVQMGALMPTVSRLLGYVPGWMGIGEDLPGGVTSDWARRCMTEGYFSPEERELIKDMLHTLQRPTLHLSVDDDTYITPEATADFAALSPAPPTEHRVYSPSQLGVSDVGHFKGFRRSAGAGLWAVMDDFMRATMIARGHHGRPHASAQITAPPAQAAPERAPEAQLLF